MKVHWIIQQQLKVSVALLVTAGQTRPREQNPTWFLLLMLLRLLRNLSGGKLLELSVDAPSPPPQRPQCSSEPSACRRQWGLSSETRAFQLSCSTSYVLQGLNRTVATYAVFTEHQWPSSWTSLLFDYCRFVAILITGLCNCHQICWNRKKKEKVVSIAALWQHLSTVTSLSCIFIPVLLITNIANMSGKAWACQTLTLTVTPNKGSIQVCKLLQNMV